MSKFRAFHPEETKKWIGNSYPKPFHRVSAGIIRHALGDHADLDQFGVNLTTIPPGNASALRHWHRSEDEFVFILSGELVLITDEGEQLMTPGMCVGFKAGVENGHHLVNRSDKDATCLEIGSRIDGEECFYPDDNLRVVVHDGGCRRDKSIYTKRKSCLGSRTQTRFCCND